MVKRLYLIGLVLVLIVSSISVATTPSIPIDKPEEDKIKVNPTGLDPAIVQNKIIANSLKRPMTQPLGPLSDDGYFYAYDALAGEVCKWPFEDPSSVETIADGDPVYFLAGGDWSCDEIWYGCEYNTGSLWIIDPDTFEMENIGGSGTSCNGLAWDPIYNRLYGAGNNGLYEYDPETGEQDFIGNYGIDDDIICLVIDMGGIAWAYDVKGTGNAILYNIDLETGEATKFCDMGRNLLYAQDGAYDRDTHTIWMAAYSNGGFFAYWDWNDQEIVQLNTLDSEYTCAMIRSCCGCVDHDVGVRAIVKPTQSSHAIPEMEMELLVQNYGYNTETFDAQMDITKYESSGPILLNENFSTGIPIDWETDFWQSSYTNNASGISPEAKMNKNWQYNGGQVYDNYIETKPFDATGYKKILISFKWAFDAYSSYGKYCNFYVKYRNDETSSWKDVTPWHNPLDDSYEGDLWEIDCYRFEDEFGENFTIRFEYIGYYYYYDNIYLDDIQIQGCGGCVEYSELEENITLQPWEEMIVSFPTWQPSEWQNESYQDAWVKYPIHGFTILWGDQKPSNNDKWILLELYYPWFYDIEVTEIGSPAEWRLIPAQTFDVEATITNVGQFPLCCIGINMEIGTPYVEAELLYEADWPGSGTYYPGEYTGWTDEHKALSYYYGWWRYSSNYAGGDPYEARLYYYYARADYHFYSAEINVSGAQSLQLEFLYYINHYSGSGLYALEAGYSTDGENWYAAWHEEPSGSGNGEVSVPLDVGGADTIYLGLWVKGDPYYFNYWYVDNVELKEVGITTEYTDFMCQGEDLEPGQSRVFNFDQWTPDFLQYETTSWEVPYKAFASINVGVDQDPDNDIKVNDFKLDYWHDPALQSVTSPTIGGRDDVIWDNGEPDGRDCLAGSIYQGYDNLIIDDMNLEQEVTASGGHISLVWNSGAGTGNLDTLYMWFFEETGDCEPAMTEYEKVEINEYTEYTTGDYYFSRPEVVIYVEFDDVEIPAGKSWVGFQPDSVGDDIAYLLTTENKGCEVMADLPYWGYPRWTSSSYLWGSAYDLAWQISGYGCGCPHYNIWIQPGTESIDAVAANVGTFPELDQTCSAEIWEYITDPQNGTLQYEDNITNIDLTKPLGGTVDLQFDDFTFAYEGRYRLFLELSGQNERDDFPKNNKINFGIAVDDTKPVSSHSLDPAAPDGENGWYVSDCEVTLSAYDPVSMDVSSGVVKIKYIVGEGPVQTIDGCCGSFPITQENDEDDVLVEYWAIDNVGNVENSHTFTIDMDQTCPNIDLIYECVSGNPIQGWLMLFTATSADITSGMDRVEFYLNGVFQETVMGSGPIYKWSFIYHGDFNLDVIAVGYDIAGNFAQDVIEDPKAADYNFNNQNTQQQSQSGTNSYVKNKLLYKLNGL